MRAHTHASDAKTDMVSDARCNSEQSPSRFCWLFKIDREHLTALPDHFEQVQDFTRSEAYRHKAFCISQ